MEELFEMIEALLRGAYDLRQERIIYVSCDIATAANKAYDELHAIGDDFANLLIEGLYDLSEEYDAGTPEEAAEYTRRVKELYEQAKAMRQPAMRIIEQFEDVKLKDGREGCVVEVYGDQAAFDVDIGSSPADWDTIYVKREDIADE